MAPVCSSWVWLNLVNTKRYQSNSYYGDESYEPVRIGNQIALACAFLWLLAQRRQVQAVCENPPPSCMWKFPPLVSVLKSYGVDYFDTICHRCAYEKFRKSLRIGKTYKLVATGAWIGKVGRKCSCLGGKHISLCKVIVKSCKKRTTGYRKLLAKSAAYPPALGIAVVKAWQTSMSTKSVPSPLSSSQTQTWLQPMLPAPPEPATASWMRPVVTSKVRHKTVSMGNSHSGGSWLSPAVIGSASEEGPVQAWLKPSISACRGSHIQNA